MRSDRHVELLALVAMLLAVLLTPAQALAHRLDVAVHVEEGNVVVEAHYHDGVPVRKADVAVTDPAGNALAEGTTDTDGRFLFTPTTIPAQISVVVDTGDGHRGVTIVSREVLAGLVGVEEHYPVAHDSSTSAPSAHDRGSAEHDDLHEIEATLARVESDLHDIAHELAHLSERHAGMNFERVLAGVGFILGLTGVAAYCLARRPTHN